MDGRHSSRSLVSIGLGVAFAAVAGLGAQRGAAPPPVPATNQAAQTPQAGTAAISGLVVDGSTGQPVFGAVVSIGAGARMTPSGSTRLVTDSRGRFVFPRLPAGNYSIAVSKSGYITMRYGQADPATSSGRAVLLNDGQWFADARVVIWRPGAIVGTITDEAGEPVVGALVRVLAQVMVAGRPQTAAGAVAKTDDRGRYRIAGLAKGRYVVMVPSVQASVPAETTLAEFAGYTTETVKAFELAGRPMTPPDDPAIAIDAGNRLIVGRYVTPPPPSAGAWVYPPIFFPSGRTLANATTIDLDYGEERLGIDIQLAPVRSVRVSGVVQGPADATPAGMTVRLLPSGSEVLSNGAETATALVSSTGAFTLLNVPAGAYTIIVSRSTMEYVIGSTSMNAMPTAPGWGGGSVGFGVIDSGSGGAAYSYRSAQGSAAYSARMPLVVGDQDLTDVTVQLRRAVTLSGRVIVAASQPASDVPAARMPTPIYAEPANGDVSLGMLTGITVAGDAAGFRIDGLLAGGYTLRLLSLGGSGAVVKSIQWQGRDYVDRPFDASSGRDIEDVVITLTTDVAKITGSVRDAKGQLASDGAVVVFPADRSLWSGYGFRPSRLLSVPISASGLFTISRFPGGDYLVVAVDSTFAKAWQDPKFLEAAAPMASKITIGWGETKTLDLTISAIKVVR